jgi:hypothetical protein
MDTSGGVAFAIVNGSVRLADEGGGKLEIAQPAGGESDKVLIRAFNS